MRSMCIEWIYRIIHCIICFEGADAFLCQTSVQEKCPFILSWQVWGAAQTLDFVPGEKHFLCNLATDDLQEGFNQNQMFSAAEIPFNSNTSTSKWCSSCSWFKKKLVLKSVSRSGINAKPYKCCKENPHRQSWNIRSSTGARSLQFPTKLFSLKVKT